MMERVGIPVPEGSVAGDDDSCDDLENEGEGEEEDVMEEDEILETADDAEALMIEAPLDTMCMVPLMEVAERPAKIRRIDNNDDVKLQQQQQQQLEPVAAAEDIPRPTNKQMQELAKEHKPSSKEPQNKHEPSPEGTLSQQASTDQAKQQPVDSQKTSTEAKQPVDSQKTSTEAKQEPVDSQKTSTEAAPESPGLELQGLHKKLPVPIHKRVLQEREGVTCCMPCISMALRVTLLCRSYGGVSRIKSGLTSQRHFACN